MDILGGVTTQEYLKAAHFIWTDGSLNTGQAALPHKNIQKPKFYVKT